MGDPVTRATRPVRRLASPHSAMQPHYDAIVVGSGYGGAIAASRLARARRADGSRLSVCLLERGEELQPGEYPDEPLAAAAAMQFDLPDKHLGREGALYDFRVNDELNAFVGCGLGGGSLVNANVALAPDERVFADGAWPAGLRADVAGRLQRGFAHAREMLKPAPYPADRPAPQKLEVLAQMSAGIGTATSRPPINVHFGAPGVNHVGVFQLPCTDCGDCVSGCNEAAKNTLLMNYLPDAVNHGAQIFTGIGVRAVERDAATGRWKVFYRVLDSGAEKFGAPETFVTADRVFLGAGALGSTEILLRSRARGLALSDRLGHGFTGNGDVLAFAYNGDPEVHPVGFAARPPADERRVGPCITGLVDLRATPDFERGMVIEDGSFPAALAPALPALMAAGAKVGAVPPGSQLGPEKLAREAEGMLLGAYHGAVDHSEVLLVMSHDDAGGRLALEDDRLRIRWPGLSEEATFARVHERLAQGAKAIDAALVKNPMWTELLGRRLVTVHPLGGCGMGESAAAGVVDHAGRVFAGTAGATVHDGLYVCDGAVMPRALGVNPLLTISAVAERTLALAAEAEGWTIDYALPSAPITPRPAVGAADQPVGLQFSETMRGYVAAGGGDYNAAAEQGRAAGQSCGFTLTITSEDVEALATDPLHRASLAGTVTCPMLSPAPLAVSQGEFQLLPLDPAPPRTRRMRYKMTLTATDGAQYRFAGSKTVRDDPGPDVWSDTTTLYVDITRTDGTAVARGVLTLGPQDFLVQMTTLRALRAPSIAAALAAKARFGRLFAGAVADTYLGPARSAPNVWPPAQRDPGPPRSRRPLRLPAPEVHFVDTVDGATLRLTRYRAGGKGPVILAHGLGVSSRIFTVDTIDTCLAEYLAASGYDLWLLDFRASIDLPSAHGQFSGDEVARFDYPAAVERVRQVTGKPDVQIVAHCFGASTLFMALAAGLTGVRSAVFSQIAGHVSSPLANAVRAGLYMPDFLKLLGIDALTTDVSADPGALERLYDDALRLSPLLRADQRCSSTACHRISFMYAPLYRHEQLDAATHEALGELFGIANLRSFQHLAAMIRKRRVVAFDGTDAYLPDDGVSRAGNLARFRFPIRLIHGALNECFLPESTRRTLELLRDANPGIPYDRVEIPGYGHIDCIFGRDAARDVYPYVAAHLEQTA
jgi:cholesterol oxidase